jgi:hypothetical protein
MRRMALEAYVLKTNKMQLDTITGTVEVENTDPMLFASILAGLWSTNTTGGCQDQVLEKGRVLLDIVSRCVRCHTQELMSLVLSMYIHVWYVCMWVCFVDVYL